MISFIFAMDENQLIGRGNELPWHLPADLQHFKRVTMGRPVIMGRKTFESIGRPLPGRKNVILTRQQDYSADGCDVIHSIEELASYGVDELFVIGGAQLFAKLLPMARRMYVTRIGHAFEGDAYFPEIDWSNWQLISETEGTVDEKNRYPHIFQVYERVATSKQPWELPKVVFDRRQS
jgi:dihydrofolate reductase